MHTTMKVTPYQSLRGRPYQGRLVCFGQTVYGLDPKATKFKPAWRKGAWIGKDSAGMDLIATDGLCIIRTKAMRKVSDQWDADLLIGMTDGPMDFFGHRQVKAREKVVALSAPVAQEIDEEAEAVRDLPLSEGYSASEPIDDSELKLRQDMVGGEAWVDVGLEHCSDAGGRQLTPDTGGAISPGMAAPVTPHMDAQSDDGDMEIPTQSHKHPSSAPLSSEGRKAQKMDDDPVPVPKIKAAKTEGSVMQIAEVEVCHNDEEMYPEDRTDDIQVPDSEDEYIAEQAEGEGPPSVSQEKLKEELDKLHQMNVIEPTTLSPEQAACENTVDTTLVFDWRFRGNKWIRRCRVVA